MDIESWNCDDVHKWLTENDFEDYATLFAKKHKIDGSVLLTLTERDLRNKPLELSVLGDIKRLWRAIDRLQTDYNRSQDSGDGDGDVTSNGRVTQRLISHSSEFSCSDDEFVTFPVSPQRLRRLKPEYLKLCLAFMYMSTVLLLTAYVMVVVHDKVPDMTRYPPLPDLMLDNIPYIPWAFELCEVTALLLMTALCVTLVFHKHR